MLELLSYIANDTRCSIAIQELNSKTSVDKWVWANMSLFKTVSINVDGLPSIASCNYQCRHYPNISEFHELFRKSLNEIDDPFKNQ
jgi:hypothetical protein